MRRAAAALPPAAHLGEIQAGGEISSAGPGQDPGALAEQSLGAELDRPGRSGRSRSVFQRQNGGVDREDGGRILHRSRFAAVAGELLGEIGFVSGAARKSAQEKHPRLVLPHRSRQRHSLSPEHRAEFGMVLHRPSRTRARPLFSLLHPAGSAAAPAHRRRRPDSTKASAN